MYTIFYFVKRFLPLSQELIALELNFPNLIKPHFFYSSFSATSLIFCHLSLVNNHSVTMYDD